MKRYQPLLVLVIVSAIVGAALLAHNHQDPMVLWMANFAGFFFVSIASLKFWDLQGFRQSFCQYDLIASRFPVYSYFYPCLEFLVGIGFLTHFFLVGVSMVTVVLMLVLLLGILSALVKGKSLQCACMGAKLDLPLGVVSVFEVVVMGAMALFIIIKRL